MFNTPADVAVFFLAFVVARGIYEVIEHLVFKKKKQKELEKRFREGVLLGISVQSMVDMLTTGGENELGTLDLYDGAPIIKLKKPTQVELTDERVAALRQIPGVTITPKTLPEST